MLDFYALAFVVWCGWLSCALVFCVCVLRVNVDFGCYLLHQHRQADQLSYTPSSSFLVVLASYGVLCAIIIVIQIITMHNQRDGKESTFTLSDRVAGRGNHMTDDNHQCASKPQRVSLCVSVPICVLCVVRFQFHAVSPDS